MLKFLKQNVILFILMGACWPVFIWLGRRSCDQSDHFLGWLPLLIILFSLIKSAGKKQDSAKMQRCLMPISVLLILYSLTYHFTFPLIRAIMAFSAISLYMSAKLKKRTFDISVWGLFMLSLPLMASMQFYVGYPLRFFAAKSAALILSISGYSVSASGATLQWQNLVISVDAPCSGLKMLYIGALTVCLLCFINNFNNLKTIYFSVTTLLVIIVANIARILFLFFPETGLVAVNPELVHTLIGSICYASSIVILIIICEFIKRKKACLKV